MASVSVVLPTRDRPEFLLEALGTVARQTHLEIELVLVRDGGAPLSDEARAAVDALEFPALLEERADGEGLAQARNRGLARARADVVAFLDDDDLWEPDHVKRLADAFDRDVETVVAYSDAWVVGEDGGTRTLAVPFDLGVFGRNGFIPPSAFAARRSAFAEYGEFDASMPYSEDWDWLLRVAHRGGKIVRVPGATATIRIHGGGLSQVKPERLAERQRCLDLLSSRYGLGPIQPKTFWDVAGDLRRATPSSR
ncbi:MAG TPA: glycosyltransferase family 2 protein [Tepidiformaceae bacterium]|nr:glycosyltransferase family 2 protein [Candidatus Eisenbacteria bacterium]HEX6029905.1 glycosyltransferase family 2 protein [Tepidiformaceae bacterium]